MHINKKILIISAILTSFIISLSANADATKAHKIHFLGNDGADQYDGDAIVIESNGRFGLIDAMNPTYKDIYFGTGDGLLSDRDNGKKVAEYLYSLCEEAVLNGKRSKNEGCYLDFFIATHSHSDHIGGILEVSSLMDDHTIAFFKSPMGSNNYWENKIERANKNKAFYDRMLDAFDKRNVIKCQTDGECNIPQHNQITITKEQGGNREITDSIKFSFGLFDIRLFNLYHPYKITDNNDLYQGGENANSIVALVTAKNGSKNGTYG